MLWKGMLALVIPAVGMATLAFAEPPATQAWSPDVFEYQRPLPLPTKPIDGEIPLGLPSTRQEQVVFKNVADHEVPVLLTLPAKGRGPFPVVILLHGFTSHRVQITRQAGSALVEQGFACLALDLPEHGRRRGPQGPLVEMFPANRPEKAHENMIEGVKDIRQAIDLAEADRRLDVSKGVAVLGYSMGSWFATLAGSTDRRIAALVLMVGGSTTVDPAALQPAGPARQARLELLDRYPDVQPTLAIGRFSPRPILMQNGRRDLLVPKWATETLYEAAGQPREIRWYDAGHLLPEQAFRDAARWLKDKSPATASATTRP